MRSYLIGAAVALSVAGFGAGGAAQASPVGPGTAAAAEALGAAPQTVRWVCGPVRCVWQPGGRGWVPPYARGWGPPRRAGCFWSKVRGPAGVWRWVQVCR